MIKVSLSLFVLLLFNSCNLSSSLDVYAARCVERCETMPQGCYYDQYILTFNGEGAGVCYCSCNYKINKDAKFMDGWKFTK